MAAAPITGINPVTANSVNASIGTGGILPSTATSIANTFSSIKLPFGTPKTAPTPATPVAAKPVAKPTTTPTTPAKEPTTLSSSNIDQKNQDNVQTATQLATSPAGQTAGQDGFVRNADQSFAEAPGDAVQATDANGNTTWQSGGMNYALGPSNGSVSSDPLVQGIYQQFTALKGQMDALGAQQIAAIQNSFDGLIKDQELTNKGEEASLNSLLIRGGSLQTGSSGGIMGSQVSVGLSKIADLNAKEQAAVIAAQQAIQSGDMQLLDKQLTIADESRKERQASAQKMSDSITAATTQARKDNAISTILSNGITDPKDILATLQAQGNTNISAKDVADTMANLNPDQKNITDLMKTASGNGASADVLKAIGSAKNYTDALQAAGLYGSGATGDMGLYQNYERQAQAKGQTPVSFESWQYMNEFNKAKAAEAGKQAGTPGLNGGTLAENNIKSLKDFPAKLQGYAHQSANGTFYLDIEGASPTERTAITALAGDVPIITDKNDHADLVNITEANKNLQLVAKALADVAQPEALTRDLYGMGLTSLAGMAQTNPQVAAEGMLQIMSSNINKAASGIAGLRAGGGAETIAKNFPSATDTQDVIAQKLSVIANIIGSRETAILGTAGSKDTTNFVIRTEQQAQDALTTAGQNNPDMQKQITGILQTKNPDTGQPYTYVEASQILGIDIPALKSQTSIFQGGTLLPNLWRELSGQGI